MLVALSWTNFTCLLCFCSHVCSLIFVPHPHYNLVFYRFRIASPNYQFVSSPFDCKLHFSKALLYSNGYLHT